MTFNAAQLFAELPLLLTILTSIVAMLAIAIKRNHQSVFYITAFGLNLAFLSALWAITQPTVEVTPLLKVDSFAQFYTVLILIGSLATVTLARIWLSKYPDNKEEFYLLLTLASVGSIVMAQAQHMASLFIGIELMSLPLFGMVGYAYRQRRSLEAALKYMVLSSSATAFLLFGIALVYAQTGQLSFSGISNQVQAQMSQGTSLTLLTLGLGMMIIGFGFKLSLVPFHLWTPDVYQGSPAPVTGYLATVSKIGVFAVLLRVLFLIPSQDSFFYDILAGIAFLSMILGNILALLQHNIKRLLGYSSTAHFGYMLVALIACRAGAISTEAVGMYMVMYILTSIGSFGVISLMSSPYSDKEAEAMPNYRGLFWRRPVLAAVMSVMFLSFAGVPVTLGFIGKFYILAVGIQQYYWWLTGAVIFGSIVGLYFYLRTISVLYLRNPGMTTRDAADNWGLTTGGLMVLLSAILIVALGVYPQPLIDLLPFAHLAAH